MYITRAINDDPNMDYTKRSELKEKAYRKGWMDKQSLVNLILHGKLLI